MKISNQALGILLVMAVGLVAVAVWLTLVPPEVLMPGPPKATRTEAPAPLPPNVYREGGSGFIPEGPVTVHAMNGMHVRLECDGLRMDREIRNGIATFEAVPTGGCPIYLTPGDELPEGQEPFEPVLPGDDIQCGLSGEVVVCRNSLAEKHSARVLVWSNGEGRVRINDEDVGKAPVSGIRLPVGRHRIAFDGERVQADYTLAVQPDERIEVLFLSPVREGEALLGRPQDAVLMPPPSAP